MFVAASPVGLGTILGSAVFNILIIVGAVAMLSTEPLNLDYRPVVRDNFFYAISVILLCALLAADDQANLVDSIILLLWYSLYILFLAFNETIMNKLAPYPAEDGEGDAEEAKLHDEDDAIATDNPLAAQGIGILLPEPEVKEEEAGEGGDKTEGAGEQEKPKEEEEEKSVLDRVVEVFSWPYEKLFEYTMPDCHLEEEKDVTQEEEWEAEYNAADKERRKEMKAELYAGLSGPQKWFWATFFISLIHITWLSYFMVEFMLKIGCLWQVYACMWGMPQGHT